MLLKKIWPGLVCGGVKWCESMTAIPASHPLERWLLCEVEHYDYEGAPPPLAGGFSTTSGKLWGLRGDDLFNLTDWYPDIKDAATQAELLQEIRRISKWGRAYIAPAHGDPLWGVFTGPDDFEPKGAAECRGEALIRTLMALVLE